MSACLQPVSIYNIKTYYQNVCKFFSELNSTYSHFFYRYRQDGIEFHQTDSNIPISSTVLPFAPTFHSFYRHKLLLTRIIPGNLQNLPNDVLNSALKV